MAEEDKPASGKSSSDTSDDTDAIDDDWGSPESSPKASAKPVERKTSEEQSEGEKDDEASEDEPEEEEDEEAAEEEDEQDDEGDEEDEDDEGEEEAAAQDADSDEEEEEEGEEDLLPDWAPWAVLIALLCIGLLGGLGVFSSAPAKDRTAADVTEESDSGASAESDKKADGKQRVKSDRQKRPQPTAADQETIEASHLLVQYKGSMRARPNITRTKEEAKKRAEEALAKAKQKGADFGAIVAEYSDEPGAAQRKGKLGSFTRRRMVKPFSDAAFKLKPGQLSDVVETPFGYHVILRTK